MSDDEKFVNIFDSSNEKDNGDKPEDSPPVFETIEDVYAHIDKIYEEIDVKDITGIVLITLEKSEYRGEDLSSHSIMINTRNATTMLGSISLIKDTIISAIKGFN